MNLVRTITFVQNLVQSRTRNGQESTKFGLQIKNGDTGNFLCMLLLHPLPEPSSGNISYRTVSFLLVVTASMEYQLFYRLGLLFPAAYVGRFTNA